MNSIERAQKELELAGLFDKDSVYGGLIGNSVMELFKTFLDQGHSGYSAAITVAVFDRLAASLPLTELTGEDWEWAEFEYYGEDEDGDETPCYNIRCPQIIKNPDGTVYNSRGKIFSDDGEIWYTNKNSRVPVTFPYIVPNEPVRVILGEDNAD